MAKPAAIVLCVIVWLVLSGVGRPVFGASYPRLAARLSARLLGRLADRAGRLAGASARLPLGAARQLAAARLRTDHCRHAGRAHRTTVIAASTR